MPATMVRKITGAMIIFTSLMKPSPSGFICSPSVGIEVAEQDADRDGDQDLQVEILPPPLAHAASRTSAASLAWGFAGGLRGIDSLRPSGDAFSVPVAISGSGTSNARPRTRSANCTSMQRRAVLPGP